MIDAVNMGVTIDGVPYILEFNASSIDLLVRESGIPAEQLAYVAQDTTQLDERFTILALWAGLQTHHPDIDQRRAIALFTSEHFVELFHIISIALALGLDRAGKLLVANESIKN